MLNRHLYYEMGFNFSGKIIKKLKVSFDHCCMTQDSRHVMQDPRRMTEDPRHTTQDPRHMAQGPRHMTQHPRHVTWDPRHMTRRMRVLRWRICKPIFTSLRPPALDTTNGISFHKGCTYLGTPQVLCKRFSQDGLRIDPSPNWNSLGCRKKYKRRVQVRKTNQKQLHQHLHHSKLK